MKRLSIIFFAIFIPGFFSMSFGQGNLGQSGANFLQIAVEPKGAALGGAVTAITEGAPALYWNPAGAIHTRKVDFSFSHTNWFIDTKLTYGAIVVKLGENRIIGLSITSFYMDEMEITTCYAPDGTGENYSSGDLSIGATYSQRMTDHFSFGVTTKYVYEYIWNEAADQISFDVGSIYTTNFYNLRLGMVIRNFGGDLEFSGKDVNYRIQEEIERELDDNPRIERLSRGFRFPQVFQMGVAVDPIVTNTSHLTLITDVEVPSDNKERIILAAEYGLWNFVYIRGSYMFNHDTGKFSVGGGINLNLVGTRTEVNYSYSDHGLLDNVHRFGFRISF